MGGAEAHTLTLAEGLRRRGYEVRLFSSNAALVSEFQKRGLTASLVRAGWEPTSVRALFLFPLTFIRSVFLFFGIFWKNSDADALLCLTLTDKLIASPIARLHGIKVVWIEHTRLGRWLTSSPLLPFYRLSSLMARIVTPSFFSRNQIIGAGAAVDRISVIPHGINIPQKQPARESNPFVLGFLGRLAYEKGVDLLLEALALLPENTRLLIAGDGPERKNLEEQAHRLKVENRVEFLGYITNTDEFFSRISILTVPSRLAESFGLAAIEAMARGIPVVACRIGALPEIVENNNTGLLVAPGSSKDLAAAIALLANQTDRLRMLGANARNRALARFDEDDMIKQYINIFSRHETRP